MTDSNYAPELIEKASHIKLLLMDVDGVMTAGQLFYIPDSKGEMVEFKGFNSHDGLGLYLCNFAGITTGIISGRNSPATTERARILNMKYVYQGKLDKISSWEEILADAKLTAQETAYIGDDWPDIPLLRRAGLAIAVGNARPEVKVVADYTTPSDGGCGAVRDACELILKARGLWKVSLDRYEVETAIS